MMDGKSSCEIFADKVPVMQEALHYADEFFLTAAGQKNRNYLEGYVQFDGISFAMEEVLFDPQTSGGLLIAVQPAQAEKLLGELQKEGFPAAIVGKIREKTSAEIYVS